MADRRVALVTGASRRIGRAIALGLARAGARVALNHCTGEAGIRALAAEIDALALEVEPELVALVAQGGASLTNGVRRGAALTKPKAGNGQAQEKRDRTLLGQATMVVRADVAKADEAQAMVEKVLRYWGRLDILVNNVALVANRRTSNFSLADWQSLASEKLDAVFNCASAAIPAMVRQQYGQIVSVLATGNEPLGRPAYDTSNHGIITFTKRASAELARHHVIVSVVTSGGADTEKGHGLIRLEGQARPEEIVQAVVSPAFDGKVVAAN